MTVASKSRMNPGLRMLVWAVVAAPLGYLVGKILASSEDAGLWAAPDLRWSDGLALFLGLLMLAVGLVTVGVSTSRKLLGRQVDPERGAPVSRAQAGVYTLTLWEAVSVMMTAYLLIALLITWRRGLA